MHCVWVRIALKANPPDEILAAFSKVERLLTVPFGETEEYHLREAWLFETEQEANDLVNGPVADFRKSSSCDRVDVDVLDLDHSITGDVFKDSTVILGAPRSGTTLLYELITMSSDAWSIKSESKWVIDMTPGLGHSDQADFSFRLDENVLTEHLRATVLAKFAVGMRSSLGEPYVDRSNRHAVRFVEKTPNSSLRIPFFRRLFPGLRFVVLLRDPREVASSLMEAWRDPVRFWSAKDLPEWPAGECWQEGWWSCTLVPGWQELRGAPLAEIAAYQWSSLNRMMIDDLSSVPRDDYRFVFFDDLIADPVGTCASLFDFLELDSESALATIAQQGLRESESVVSAPRRDKWRKNEEALRPYIPELMAQWEALRTLASETGAS